MADPREVLNDPTNRVVCVFDNGDDAIAAREELRRCGCGAEEVHILHGRNDAEAMDTSPKWFADTDQEMQRYQHQLASGNTVLAALVHDRESRDAVHQVLKSHNARMVTHFGEWITEMMR